jgi:hypothetical protein
MVLGIPQPRRSPQIWQKVTADLDVLARDALLKQLAAILWWALWYLRWGHQE